MAEEGAATATATEPATGEEGKSEEGAGASTEEGKLGPEGEKALAAFKQRARDAEKRERELAERLEKIEEANKSESEKALDKARKEARQEAETEFEKERRSDRLAVAVAGHARELADVDDVVLNLKQGSLDELFDAEGKVDAEALKKRLDALLKTKPHLKAGGANSTTDFGGGARTTVADGDMDSRIRRAAGRA